MSTHLLSRRLFSSYPTSSQAHPLRRLLGVAILCAALLLVPGRLTAAPDVQEGDTPVHTVAPGETLSEIAERYGVSMQRLMERNGIVAPEQIRIGQELRLPVEPDSDRDSGEESGTGSGTGSGKGIDSDSTSAEAAPARVTPLNRTVTVREGDTLARIALRYGVDLSSLLALNGLDATGSTIVQGQSLRLPATADELRVRAADEIYVVEAGDSLGLIAQARGLTLAELKQANPFVQADRIYPGQELVIPGRAQTESAAAIGPARSGFLYHRVEVGETMSQLAQVYNTTPQAIVRYNGLPDESTIYSGLEVRIPFGPPQLDRRRPPTPETGSEFVVSITRQQCWVMQNQTILYSWRCSTGQGQWATRTGTFPIKTKLEIAQSSAYRLDMPYWLGLYDVGAYENGIHGLPVDWTTGEKLWDTLIGQPATFGCAMLLDEDAATLFHHSYLGMPVHIVD